MTLFFNEILLEELSSGNVDKYMCLLEYHYTGKLPNKNSKYKLTKNLKGYSFLLNPEPLFTSKVDILYKVQYIKLASRRDYSQYKYAKIAGLLISYYPDIIIEQIKHNPLLIVTEIEINFKYER